jgi:glycosyl hydrolase family 15
MSGGNNSLMLREQTLGEDAHRILQFLEQQGTFRFPTLTTGLFSAAAGEGGDFELTGYRSVWVRDNIHIAHAHLMWGNCAKAEAALKSLMAYFTKYRHRFTDAIEGRSDPQNPMHRPHIRFDGGQLIEVDERWSHAQNDALGAFLWLYSEYCRQRPPGTPTAAEWEMLVEIVYFLKTIQYWQDEDSGPWTSATTWPTAIGCWNRVWKRNGACSTRSFRFTMVCDFVPPAKWKIGAGRFTTCNVR